MQKKEIKMRKARDFNLVKDTQEKVHLQYEDAVKNFKSLENDLGKIKLLKDEELNVLKMTKNTKQTILAELVEIEKNMKKLEKQAEEAKVQESAKNELKKQELELKENYDREAKNLEEIKTKLLGKVEQLKANIEELKNLRETIGRTVIRLKDDTKTINEEIQIKELIFLDMTKKNEELRNLYQKYHILYETVLAERNKNVVKIQNSNQWKAEIKEKMKIIITEMDIIKAELKEVNNGLSEKNKELNNITQMKNAIKLEINKFQYDYKTHEEEIKKLTNENEKLNSILNSIESDMVVIRVDYELACESRNYTGIQLIDRNDELCIFYEKIQQLESEINVLYKSILEKESVNLLYKIFRKLKNWKLTTQMLNDLSKLTDEKFLKFLYYPTKLRS